MNNTVFGKTMENIRKSRNIRLVANENRRNYLVSEPNYLTIMLFANNLLAIEMRKTEIRNVDVRFGTPNFELGRSSPKEKIKK